MNKLGEWSNLASTITHELDNENSLWEESKRDIYLGLYIRAFLKLKDGIEELIPDDDKKIFRKWSEEEPNPLILFLQNSLKDPGKKYLKFFKCIELI